MVTPKANGTPIELERKKPKMQIAFMSLSTEADYYHARMHESIVQSPCDIPHQSCLCADIYKPESSILYGAVA